MLPWRTRAEDHIGRPFSAAVDMVGRRAFGAVCGLPSARSASPRRRPPARHIRRHCPSDRKWPWLRRDRAPSVTAGDSATSPPAGTRCAPAAAGSSTAATGVLTRPHHLSGRAHSAAQRGHDDASQMAMSPLTASAIACRRSLAPGRDLIDAQTACAIAAATSPRRARRGAAVICFAAAES